MKLIYLTLITFVLCNLQTNILAQDFDTNEKEWLNDWTNFEPNTTNYPDAKETLPTVITDDTYLTSDMVYLLSGDVYVSNNSTLTIEEGTVIRCDHKKSTNLIITKGSKLIAAGTKKKPIIFTSNKPAKSRASGDWGGIMIAGAGKVNSIDGTGRMKGNLKPQYATYGGANLKEQTTVLKYVRIEYPGKNTNSSGLSLYGLGSSTLINNVMVSYSAKDSFHWNGGINNLTKVISYKAEEDDFEFTEGFKGQLDNIMAIRHPYISSASGSYAIRIEGFDKESSYIRTNLVTDVTISDATLINLADETNYIYTKSAISANNSASIYLHNSKISGFADIVEFDKSYSSLAAIDQFFMMDNSFFNIHGEGVKTQFNAGNGILNVLKYNRFTENFVTADTLFANPNSRLAPNFNLKQSRNTYMVMH